MASQQTKTGILFLVLVGLVALLALFFIKANTQQYGNLLDVSSRGAPRPLVITDTLILPSAGAKKQKALTLGTAQFIVDVADSEPARTNGLSGRDKLGDTEGMLFLFDAPGRPSFWMKDMRFSIDIIWIQSDGIVAGITHNVSPKTYPKLFRSKTDIRYVLEISAGRAREVGLRVGDQVF